MAQNRRGTPTDSRRRELIDHGTTLFPVACYHDDLRDNPLPWHWHDELEALVVTEGQAVVAVGTEKHCLRAGEGLFINTGVLHAAWNADLSNCRFRSVVFHPRLVGGGLDSIFWQKYLQPLLASPELKSIAFSPSVPWHQEAIQRIGQAWQSCFSEEPGYEFQVRSALSQLVFLSISHRPAVQRPLSEKSRRDSARIKTMLQYIQEHYSEDLDAAQISASATISESECLRCFHTTIGTTPIQYLKQFRIQKAAMLLTTTNLKVADIGAQCGFQEMSYFAKAFRSTLGCTPSQYRSQKLDEAANQEKTGCS